ncbi:hypothetical protein DASC09_000630 [Saccharomycopsis crataegensis]|uniref:Uncharacterized protein n=1 Tax=Saccharomycopsis crataegensis TaxID=43959 RepID=A0AAV5QDB9_9ASCO|nr:hypothetical protein DASC09_000630 [Saccharomycopsis crataegensis]
MCLSLASSILAQILYFQSSLHKLSQFDHLAGLDGSIITNNHHQNDHSNTPGLSLASSDLSQQQPLSSTLYSSNNISSSSDVFNNPNLLNPLHIHNIDTNNHYQNQHIAVFISSSPSVSSNSQSSIAASSTSSSTVYPSMDPSWYGCEARCKYDYCNEFVDCSYNCRSVVFDSYAPTTCRVEGVCECISER